MASTGIPWFERIIGKAGEVGHDLVRAGHVEGALGFEKIALGVDVNEDLGTIKHGE